MLEIFKANFSDADIALILGLDRRFPERNIAWNFEYFLSLKPEQRLAQAEIRRKTLKRRGWVQKGVPEQDAENVDEHQEDMKYIARTELGGHAELDAIVEITDNHDTPEVICSDFTPDDGVSALDKYRIEYLAAMIIFEAHPDRMARWIEFEERKTKASVITKDLDTLQMFKRAQKYEITHPQANMNIHLNYCRQYAYKTDEGREIFKKLELKPT